MQWQESSGEPSVQARAHVSVTDAGRARVRASRRRDQQRGQRGDWQAGGHGGEGEQGRRRWRKA